MNSVPIAYIVTPAKAGVQSLPLASAGGDRFGFVTLDPAFRGNDNTRRCLS